MGKKKDKKKKKKPRIRPLAICVFRRGDKIFVAEGHDRVKDQTFYRPIGGAIEFGEYAEACIQRELLEELNQPVRDLRYLGTLENIFTFEGAMGHEIVRVYDGAFVDEAINADDIRVEGWEADMKLLYVAVWKSLDDFRGDDAPPLYPVGLLALLDSTA